MDENIKKLLTETASHTKEPFYLFDTDRFVDRLTELREMTQSKTGLCFAMKCNPFMTGTAAGYVDRIEVCSYGEYCICRKSGVPAEKLLISGVLKKPNEIEMIMKETKGKARFTAESMFQFALLLKLAEQYRYEIKVYLRLSSGNQFGLDKAGIRTILGMTGLSNYIDIVGLHYYSGSQKRKPEKTAKELQKLDIFLSEIEEECAFHFDELEYGPGIAVRYFTDQDENQDEEFFGNILSAIDQMNWKGHITIEMGRAAAASCGYYVTRVCDVKQSNGINYCITDGGMHQLNFDGQIRGMYHPFVDVLSDKAYIDEMFDDEKMSWTICGCLCTANDVLCAGMSLGKIRPGDFLAFENAGAYCMVEGMALFLSHELPKIYAYSADKGLTVLRDAQECWIYNTNI